MNTTVVRINITIPKLLVSELEKETPKRGKSSFISTAIKEKLIRERRIVALNTLAQLPPTFRKIRSSTAYVANLRNTDDDKRTRELAA